VYREALAEYVVRRDAASITSALDEVADAVGQDRDRWLDEAGRAALERNEW
jgi:predicted transcriptional regulator